MTGTGRRGAVVLAAALAALLVAAQGAGASPAALARYGLGAAALVLAAWWLARGGTRSAGAPVPALRVAARAGLSARCGAALVDADGRRYLVTYGDGFANVLQVSAPEPAVQRARRPALPPRRRAVTRREARS